MAESFFGGLGIIAASAVVNATYPWPIKCARAWRWENTWLVFTVLALLAIPWGAAFIVAPGFARLLSTVPAGELAPGFALGCLWGLAQVSFGVSLGMVGMAMAFAILVGVSTVIGSAVPLALLQPGELGGPRGAALAVSAAILAAGLALYARAAGEREAQAPSANFGKGLALCLFTGALAGFINLGFAFSGDLLLRAASLGANPLQATFAVWPVVLAGGAVPNLAYTAYLMVKNRSARLYLEAPARDGALAAAAAVLWIAGVFGYGLGASVMGPYGTSAGYAIFQILLMLWSTALGVMTGEWRTARPAAMRRMRAAVAVIAAAVAVLASSGL